uniref:Uncharacterized protein AlNc14C1286G12865 n=1 Tax=Albugo laibachii Nc14 TaxID=890382 RepID=F0X2L9_9STRA|nr:hypothetical protein ALNC14_142760 [Albugo laibachii Nc14]|eukprot:CCA28132.1 hypothetical protein ALNC14_142760 [Albugo laibachii Nc14]
MIYDALQRRTRACQLTQLTSGWYSYFLGRHAVLESSTRQSIGRVRNSVGNSSVDVLINTMVKLLIEKKIDSSGDFNMDETLLTAKSTTRTVIAIRDSTNVWTQEIKTNFHMSVVAAVSASGFASPLIILPVVRLFKTELAGLSNDGARVTGAPKGCSNATIFKDWLEIFTTVLKAQGIEKAVILILDNSSTHVNIGKFCKTSLSRYSCS